MAEARKGYIPESVADAKLAEVEDARQQLAAELEDMVSIRDDWEERALAAEKSLAEERVALEGTIVALQGKYQKLKDHVLRHYNDALGECSFTCL